MHEKPEQFNVYPCDDGYFIIYDDIEEVIIAKTCNRDVANGICKGLNLMPEWLDEDTFIGESVH